MKKNISKIVYGITLAAVTFMALYLPPFSGFYFTDFMAILVYLLLAATLLLGVFDQIRSGILRVVSLLIMVLIGLFICVLVFGGMLDILGVQCEGMFNTTAHCVTSVSFLSMLLVSYVYIPAKFILLLVLLFGAADEISRRYKKPQDPTPAKK